MAITTVAGIASGRYAQRHIYAGGVLSWGTNTPSKLRFVFTPYKYVPVAKALGTPGVNGATLSSTDTTIVEPTPTPPSGSAYLESVRCEAGSAAVSQLASDPVPFTVWVVDPLWYNSGLSVTTTTEQAITTPTLPARDNSGSTSGVGVMAGLLCVASTTSANTTMTLRYTDPVNGGNRTGVITDWPANPGAGLIMPFGLQAGDTGITSIEGLTLNSSLTAGTISLVLFRPLAMGSFIKQIGRRGSNGGVNLDAITLGLPKLHSGTGIWTFAQADSGLDAAGFIELGFTYG